MTKFTPGSFGVGEPRTDSWIEYGPILRLSYNDTNSSLINSIIRLYELGATVWYRYSEGFGWCVITRNCDCFFIDGGTRAENWNSGELSDAFAKIALHLKKP